MRICHDVKVRHLVKVGFSFVFAFMIISLPLATKRRFFPVFVSIDLVTFFSILIYLVAVLIFITNSKD